MRCENCGDKLDYELRKECQSAKDELMDQENENEELQRKLEEMRRLLLVSRARSNYCQADWNKERAKILNLKTGGNYEQLACIKSQEKKKTSRMER